MLDTDPIDPSDADVSRSRGARTGESGLSPSRGIALAGLRIVGELAGIGFGVAVLYGALLLSLVISYGVLYLAGALLVGAFVWLWLLGYTCRTTGMSPRVSFDLVLLALVPATILTIYSIATSWPFRDRRSAAHGWGAGGGEPNLMWLLPLHLAFFALLVLGWAHLARRRARVAAG